MGGLMGNVRGMGMTTIVTLLAICGYIYLHHPDFAAGAAEVRSQIGQIANRQTREQMEIPIALKHPSYLPKDLLLSSRNKVSG